MENNKKLISNISDIFLFSALFPFVNFNLLPVDTQPFTFLIGIYAIATYSLRFYANKIFRLSAFLIFFGLLISSIISTGESYYLYRGFYNYTSFIFYLFIFSYLYKFDLINNQLIVLANYIYILFAIIQIFFPSLINFFVASKVENSFFNGRGLSSLTPEPTHFGIILVLLSILIFINSGYKLNKFGILHLINLLSIFLISRSMSIILILFFASILLISINIKKFLNKNFYKYFLGFLPCFLIGIWYSINYETRVYRIFTSIKLNEFFASVKTIINADLSISNRIQHFLVPVLSFFRDFGVPHAFDSIGKSSLLINEEIGYFNDPTQAFKIMSFLGDWIYTLGIFGFISLFVIFYPLFSKKYEFVKTPLIIFITLLITSVPISLPIVPAVIAGFYFKRKD